MRQGIRVGHSRPYHPQTQGKLERFHRSLKAEVLQGRCFSDAIHIQHAFDQWRDIYNFERPHEALGMNVPASRYQPSPRQYLREPPAAEYDEGTGEKGGYQWQTESARSEAKGRQSIPRGECWSPGIRAGWML